MANEKYKRGHRSIETKAIQRRYLGFFKLRYIKIELVPYLILAGISHAVRKKLSLVCSLDDVAEMVKKSHRTDLVQARKELVGYIHHELPYLGDYSADEIINLLRIGATLLKRIQGGISWQKAHKIRKARHQAKYGKIMRYILNGREDVNWYEETKAAFEAFLPGYNIDLFISLFALTSPRTNFASNLKLALKAYDMFTGKIEFEEKGFLGSTFIILKQFREGLFVFQSGVRGSKRKINNFKHSITGKDHITVDMWILKAFGLLAYYVFKGKRYPYSTRDGEYDVVEAYLKGLSRVVQIEGRQINAMIWRGIRQEEYEKDATTDTSSLLVKALKRHEDPVLKRHAEGKIIMTVPVHLSDKRVQCLDYSLSERERVYLVADSKQGSQLYRKFDGKPKRHCSGCPFPKGCVMCTLP
jgi:hypothetical protein